jgi:hypothetical protein
MTSHEEQVLDGLYELKRSLESIADKSEAKPVRINDDLFRSGAAADSVVIDMLDLLNEAFHEVDFASHETHFHIDWYQFYHCEYANLNEVILSLEKAIV